MYKTILIPLDATPSDEAILQHIRPLARLTDARIWLIHVADGHAARNQESLNLEDSEEIRQDRAYLERRQAELAAEGYNASIHLDRGDPATRILAWAEKVGADLIAMSTHGHGPVMDFLLGSVASDVRHRTGTPVLLIRAQKQSR